MPLSSTSAIEFGGETAPDPATVEEINALLAEVSGNLRLN